MMKVTKHTLEITVEVLSIDSVPSLLSELAASIKNGENTGGAIRKSDGDTAVWKTETAMLEIGE